ncbi:MAG: GTPase Era [Lachnospiraceae bacterium]|nr:GTPase Era [Lachnospiraceae bacterium]
MENQKTETAGKAGFVTIIGRPNVGKSTLMNRMIGQKIAITSYKPQTTRTRIRTVYTDERGQIVFLDTPGIHKAANRLGEYMYKAALGTLNEVDLILWLIEPREKRTEMEAEIAAMLREVKTPVLLVVNKTDTVKKEEILPVIAAYTEDEGNRYAEVLPVSARTGEGVDALMDCIYRFLPEGAPFYDADTVTTETEREIAAEMIREKALRLLQEEVPHGIAVTIEQFRYRKRGNGREICDIEASVICEKNSHKGIIIGKGGEMLRKIGMAARQDIEEMLQVQVNLKLFVKVRKDWKDNDLQMKSFGYDIKELR